MRCGFRAAIWGSMVVSFLPGMATRGATLSRVSPQSVSKARAGDILFVGDRLLSPEQPMSFISCPEKTLFTLAGGSEATCRASGTSLTAGRIADRKSVALCFLPEMVRVSAASRQQYGVGLVRAGTDQLAARLQSMPEAQRNAFLAEWSTVEAALLQDPRNISIRNQADAILAKYGIPAEAFDRAPALPPSAALRLWREMGPLLAADRVDAAKREIVRSPATSASLYSELLFDAVDSRLGPSAPVSPLADKVRALLAQSNQRTAQLEAQFRRWELDRKRTFSGSPVADLVGRYIDIFSNRQPAAEQYQEILDAALPLGVELAAAGAWSNLSASAVQGGKPDEALPSLQLAEMVWRSWKHVGGMMIADYLAGRIDAASGKLEAAMGAYGRAADAAAGVPEMRQFRLDVLTQLASVQRSLGIK